MGQAIAEVLPFAIGVAVVPIPVIAVILMLFSGRARVNGPVFLLGWVTGLTAVFAVVYALARAGDVDTDETASDGVGRLRIVLGALLLLLAGRTWRKRRDPDAEHEMPRWMSGIDALAPGKAGGLGLALATLNPKNLVLVVGAATGLAGLGLATGDALAGLVAFVLVGSLGVGLPVGYYFTGGATARSKLEELKGWLGLHDEAIMAVLLLVLGVVLVSQGLAPLTGGA